MENIVDTKKRPVFLDLTKMRFPVTAIVSIMHRISGVLLFLLLPLTFYLLGHSLASQASFDALRVSLTTPVLSFLVWVLLCSVSFHLFAGIRHLFMDCGIGESLRGARNSAYLIFVLEVVAMIAAGVWIWG